MNVAATINIQQLLDLSKRAAEVILDIYEHGFDIEEKADESPVTTADLAANDVIMTALSALAPDVPIVSEEDVESIDTRWTTFWLVDPLDGTRHFIKRDGQFTINIALIESGVPTLGLVHVPVEHKVYVGLNDQAFMLDDRLGMASKKNIDTRAVGDVVAAVLSTSESTSFVQVMSTQVKQLTGCGDVEALRAGSALKFCTLATGDADVYPRLQGSYLWDVAAGDAVLRAAGGGVRRLNGEPFVYQLDELLNPPFVAYGDPTFAWWNAVPQPE